jgi:hypothetical protein
MKRFLFFLSSFLLIVTYQSHAQLDQDFEMEAVFFDLWNIHALNDDSLIVVDIKNNAEALQLISVANGEILSSKRIGRGPGEISSDGAKIITITSNRISLWDSGAKQLLQYNRRLNYQNSLLIDSPVMYVAPVDDSLAFASTSFPTKEFLHLYKVNGRSLSSTPINTYSTDVNEKLKPISTNHLLQQGPFLVDDGTLYIGFDFSSLIIKASPNSIIYINGNPANIPLPDYDAVKKDGYTTTTYAPDVAEFPQATLDFSVDDDYLYVLHSGKKLETSGLSKVWASVSAKVGKLIEDLDYAKEIFIYHKETGKYLRTLNLPQEAKKIAVSENYIFALSLDDEGLPVIIGYEKAAIN